MYVPDFGYRKLKPGGLAALAFQCLDADAPEHRTHGSLIGRGAQVQRLRVQAGRDGRQKGCLLVRVQFLGLVKDQQVTMLAAAAVAGTGQELDARAAFQNDLFAPDGCLDLGYIAPQLGALEKIPHFFKGLGGGFLQVGGVDDLLVVQQHSGLAPGLDQQAFAVLARYAAARRGCGPLARRGKPHPVVQYVTLPGVQHGTAHPHQLGSV